MDTVQIRTEQGDVAFKPGEEIKGAVSWALDKEPESAELRFFWFTRGKGDTDVGIVERARYDSPGMSGDRKFHFLAPQGPLSFSGKLISLVWALELVFEPSGKTERLEIIIAPQAREIQLSA